MEPVLPDAPESAIRLLGSVVRCGPTAGRIVETEYYCQSDPASHTFSGKTARNWPMFEDAGRLYVYRSYGIHWCANVVLGGVGEGSAALIRAIEPLDGVAEMWVRRPKARREVDLGSGPGKVCAALAIHGDHSGSDLFGNGEVQLEMAAAPDPSQVLVGRRVGISKAVDKPWRFALASAHVSKPRVDRS